MFSNALLSPAGTHGWGPSKQRTSMQKVGDDDGGNDGGNDDGDDDGGCGT